MMKLKSVRPQVDSQFWLVYWHMWSDLEQTRTPKSALNKGKGSSYILCVTCDVTMYFQTIYGLDTSHYMLSPNIEKHSLSAHPKHWVPQLHKLLKDTYRRYKSQYEMIRSIQKHIK